MFSLVAIPTVVIALKQAERVYGPKEPGHAQLALFPAKIISIAAGNRRADNVWAIGSTKQIDAADSTRATTTASIETIENDRSQGENSIEQSFAATANGQEMMVLSLAILAPYFIACWCKVIRSCIVDDVLRPFVLQFVVCPAEHTDTFWKESKMVSDTGAKILPPVRYHNLPGERRYRQSPGWGLSRVQLASGCMTLRGYSGKTGSASPISGFSCPGGTAFCRGAFARC